MILFYHKGPVQSINIWLKKEFHLIVPQPEIDLQQIGDGLGAFHQLAIPRPRLLLFDHPTHHAPIDQMEDGRMNITQKQLQPSVTSFV